MSNSLRAKRHMCDSSFCARCSVEEESSIHIIRDCYKARNIWNYFVDSSCWDNNISTELWLKDNLVIKAEVRLRGIPWIYWFSAIVFHIWKDRNAEVINS